MATPHLATVVKATMYVSMKMMMRRTTMMITVIQQKDITT
jgi:hypothetical protein